MHQSARRILHFFEYAHLPDHLAVVSQPFCELAHAMADQLDGAEATVCLRKLLEAKDCAVRAKLS